MKILFVNPPFVRSAKSNNDDVLTSPLLPFHPAIRKLPHALNIWKKVAARGLRFGVRAGSRWPWTADEPLEAIHYPFIMGYAVAYLKKQGFECDLIDAVAQEEYSYKHFLSQLKKLKPTIVVMETSMPSFDIDIKLAEQMSKFADVCFAGSHITHFASQIQKDYPFIKYLLKGEYIYSSLEMAQTLRAGIYEPGFVRDIDSLPHPYRDYPEATRYYDHTMPTPKPQLQIYGSIGCPYKCTYCLWTQTMYMHKVALRQPKKIAAEIRKSIKKYGYKSILFDDDTFNLGGHERISQICDELKKIGLPWTMMGRLDLSPSWLFDKMVESGCVGMRFGLETFDIEVGKNISKGLERINAREVIGYLANKYPKLMLRVFMMKDLPKQTAAIHKKDMQILFEMGFALEGNIYRQIQLSSCVPFPGTQMYEQIKSKKIKSVLSDYRLYDGNSDTVMSVVKKSKLK